MKENHIDIHLKTSAKDDDGNYIIFKEDYKFIKSKFNIVRLYFKDDKTLKNIFETINQNINNIEQIQLG